ncbi:hypothetical protein F441_18332 [Phytophthora nicotianae CJ01A1]|uniref:Uncharacterized protein n=7 Tax=Phytophthora TaxID=4783 RepID=W2PKS1_PHYN3|nr:hypothetical protein PPTG_17067 [Phytophthora nicotianae INRA-310]ETI35163.1 hypothetical protein F443_18458 [Phytophthora nicotianae P1569]ETK75417.1 hypothetical protein L915_17966 [Phytophthora nicotianae]ETO63920.1 hypothetical protein F444_18463 [Phytophthora nicotianae P1976]ETP04993.1 hypothetical protein F441_18332 [Phytophthora nicotianae CJ01A1]ETP33139.1 hypothetical protein F442_18287 [Phytophthora nicotianae P10297]KUG01030.1 hypothetical protein AM587_10009927 [Phytophthora n
MTEQRSGGPKRRRPSYLVRQDEVKRLQTQLQVLQRQLKRLQARPRSARAQILDVVGANNSLRDVIHGQQLAVAGARSMLAGMQERQTGSPLCRHIHLPREWWERRQVLLSLKSDMITRGCQYVVARSQHLDLMKPQLMDHRYEDAQGNFCCERFEFFHFTGVQSIKQVFEAIKYFMLNMEITISEALGHTTVREDYDTVDDGTSLWNYRLLSTDSHGITSEVNKVVLTEYFDESVQMGGEPCAVVVTDSVDVDNLYPYNPQERVRRDISATTVLTEMKRKKQKRSMSTESEQSNESGNDRRTSDGDDMLNEGEEDELVVVMQRVAFMKMHKPEFEISRSAMRSLKEGIASWGEVEVQSIRGAVNA